jgi:hypothetical protein
MALGFKRATGREPSIVHAVLWELDELARPTGNCFGAVVVDADIIAAARLFIQTLCKEIPYRPMVVPTAAGKLQLVWFRGQTSLEMEFVSPRTIHFSKSDGDAGVEEEGTFSAADVDLAVALVLGFRTGTSRTVPWEAERPVARRCEYVPVCE